MPLPSPTLSLTLTGWPTFFDKTSATTTPMISAVVPLPKPITIVMGLFGYCCA